MCRASLNGIWREWISIFWSGLFLFLFFLPFLPSLLQSPACAVSVLFQRRTVDEVLWKNYMSRNLAFWERLTWERKKDLYDLCCNILTVFFLHMWMWIKAPPHPITFFFSLNFYLLFQHQYCSGAEKLDRSSVAISCLAHELNSSGRKGRRLILLHYN